MPLGQIGRWLFIFCGVLLLLWQTLALSVLRVSSGSMSPTAAPGDWILVQRMSVGAVDWARRNDVAVFYFPSGSRHLAIKRVVGLPGDTVLTGSTLVTVNGRPIPALTARGAAALPSSSRAIPPDALFLLGDNTAASIDSRWFGPVPARDVFGRVLMILPQSVTWSALAGMCAFLVALAIARVSHRLSAASA